MKQCHPTFMFTVTSIQINVGHAAELLVESKNLASSLGSHSCKLAENIPGRPEYSKGMIYQGSNVLKQFTYKNAAEAQIE